MTSSWLAREAHIPPTPHGTQVPRFERFLLSISLTKSLSGRQPAPIPSHPFSRSHPRIQHFGNRDRKRGTEVDKTDFMAQALKVECRARRHPQSLGKSSRINKGPTTPPAKIRLITNQADVLTKEKGCFERQAGGERSRDNSVARDILIRNVFELRRKKQLCFGYLSRPLWDTQ